jgi:phosphonate transport system substrate-binding protein
VPLHFAISQRHGSGSAIEAGQAFARVLGDWLREPVRLSVTADYEEQLAGVVAGTYQTAWMPPLTHVRAAEAGATLAAVSERAGALTYRSALLVRADSAFTSVRSLKAARAAWTDPDSAAGHLFPRLHLIEMGVIPGPALAAEAFVGSAASSCAAVAEGQADLCACFVPETVARDRSKALDEVAKIFPAARWKLRLLDLTDPIPPDGVVLAPGMDPIVGARISQVLVQLHESAEGRDALAKLMFADRLVPPDRTVAQAIALLRRVRALAERG